MEYGLNFWLTVSFYHMHPYTPQRFFFEIPFVTEFVISGKNPPIYAGMPEGEKKGLSSSIYNGSFSEKKCRRGSRSPLKI